MYCGVDVRSADSLPEPRAIDCENAARCVNTKGARRVARVRRDDMMVSGRGRCVVVGVKCGEELKFAGSWVFVASELWPSV
jgi:hypothetical protein